MDDMRPAPPETFDLEDKSDRDDVAQQGQVRVMIRVRPALTAQEEEQSKAVQLFDDRTLAVSKGDRTITGSFHRVLDSAATQADVFECVQSQVLAVMDGYNSTVFAYGQTGTGKTHTMLGPPSYNPGDENHADSAGIIPRTCSILFDKVTLESHQADFLVLCSFVEIYNESVFDLLPTNSGPPAKVAWFKSKRDVRKQEQASLQIKMDVSGSIVVPGLSQHIVRTTADVMQLIEHGLENRVVAHTEYNAHSSRSHAIVQLTIERRPFEGPDGLQGSMTRAKLNLVDLAGSERWRKEEGQHLDLSTGRVDEMTAINQSLSTLSKCIAALTEKGRTHVPFRESKLTHLLQDALGGNSGITVIATLSAGKSAAEESFSTLNFALRAKKVLVYATINQVFPGGTSHDATTAMMRHKYEAEINRLRRMLADATMHPTRSKSQEEDSVKYKFELLEYEHSTQTTALERLRKQHAQEKKKNQRLENDLKQVRFDLYMCQRELEKLQQSTVGRAGKAWAAIPDTDITRSAPHTARSCHTKPRRRRRGIARNLQAMNTSSVDSDLLELGEEGEAVLAMLAAQEEELARIRAERSAVELAMKQIENGSYDDYYSQEEEVANIGVNRTQHAQVLRDSERLPTALSKSPTKALRPAPPESRASSAKSSKAPRKNWKSDYGNWIYILGKTGSSLRAKEHAKHNGIDKYSSLSSVLK